MTTFEALSIIAQFSVSIIATLTLIVAIVVFLNQKSNRPRPMVGDYFFR